MAMKKVAILYSKYSPTIDAIKYQLKDTDITCFTEAPSNTDDYDLVLLINYNGSFSGNALRCHHSLLPAFRTDTPIKDAMLEGVKVTGITIYNTSNDKIITQYPVFIKDMHYDELKQELDYIEQTIYPLVAEKVLLNQTFDINKLVSNGCSGNCGGCSGCKH